MAAFSFGHSLRTSHVLEQCCHRASFNGEERDDMLSYCFVMKNGRSKTSCCHARHSRCTGHSSAALDSSSLERAFEDFSPMLSSELQARQALPASPPSFLGHQRRVDACTMYQLFYPLPVELHVSWAGFTAPNTLTCLFSVTHPGTEEKETDFHADPLAHNSCTNRTLTFALLCCSAFPH